MLSLIFRHNKRGGGDGDLVQVDLGDLGGREDGCNSVRDPLSPKVRELFARTLALELLELA